jgi:hypothetical protein
MVKTTYPFMWKYINKWSLLAYGLFFLVPFHGSFYLGFFSWKRGKLPRLAHNDGMYQKMVNSRGLRDKFLFTPALEFYPDTNNRMHIKNIKHFLKKHRPV